MSDFDWSDLDARLLRLLTTVVETGSITGAAERLGVTQSAVSHLLQKLRNIVGDELFVKSGRGIRPTPRAEALAARAQNILRDLQDFAAPEWNGRKLHKVFRVEIKRRFPWAGLPTQLL